MLKLLGTILTIAAIFGIGGYIFSDKGNPKERAQEAAGSALAGGVMSLGCLVQLILSAIPALLGFMLIRWLFF